MYASTPRARARAKFLKLNSFNCNFRSSLRAIFFSDVTKVLPYNYITAFVIVLIVIMVIIIEILNLYFYGGEYLVGTPKLIFVIS